MPNKLNVVLLLLVGLTFPIPVSAHSFGQPPYFKVNGVYSQLYPVPTTSLENFNLPQDQTPAKYLVNQPINFEIDTTQMSVPPDVVAKTTFTWDFGDGAKGTGLKQNHSYSKVGSYILQIHAQDSTVTTPQLLETAELNIVSSLDYQLPKSVILINGRQSSDPLTDIFSLPMTQSISFDGSKSFSPNGKIVSYTWDFGDQKSSSQVQDSHAYSNDLSQVFPVLRVTDDQGFFADSFVEIKNGNQSISNPSLVPTNNSGTKQSLPQTNFWLGGIVGLVILGGAFLIFKRRGKPHD